MEDGRRYFHYRMDSADPRTSTRSSRRATRCGSDRWNDVAIEIYYQPGHEYNLDRMIAATKASLDYYTRASGRTSTASSASSSSRATQTLRAVVPEHDPVLGGDRLHRAGARDDPEDIDYPYYVTAHEVAHQWWAHQVIGANVQGATMLVETLAQYSALMVMKQKYGAAKMQRFLRYELDRYLIGRSTEQKKELPLSRVENQDYIHYRKGSLVMYALADYIGEDNLEPRDPRVPQRWAFKGPPYSTTKDLLARIRAVTPADWQYLIDDFFDTITLFDNRALSASRKAARRRPLRGDASRCVAKKLSAGELGKEDDAPLHDYIDIGVLDAGQPSAVSRETEDRWRAIDVHRRRRREASARGDRPLQRADRSPAEGQHDSGNARMTTRGYLPSLSFASLNCLSNASSTSFTCLASSDGTTSASEMPVFSQFTIAPVLPRQRLLTTSILIRQRTTFSGFSQPFAASGLTLKPSFSSPAIKSEMRWSERAS